MPAANASILPASTQLRLVGTACLTNVAMGVLYVWSLFLLPMEAFLQSSRAELSLVPTLALVTFTLGMFVHDALLRRLGFRLFAVLAFGLAGGGHLVFALSGNLVGLVLGYGLAFGFGSGLGYGLALALVMQLPEARRSLAIGLVMAAFAVSGITLSSLLAGPIQAADPRDSFMALGAAILVLGLGGLALMPARLHAARVEARVPATSLRHDLGEARFLTIFAVFFAICFSGLLVVSHSTGIVAARGAAPWLIGLTPGAFTLGYVMGSFLGGRLVEAFSGRTMLIASNLLAGAALAVFFLPASPVVLVAALVIGMVFGGSASLMPVLIGEQFGASRVGEVYGKLMLAYGLAGLVAPALSGKIFAMTGSYGMALGLALALSLAGQVLGARLGRSPQVAASG